MYKRQGLDGIARSFMNLPKALSESSGGDINSIIRSPSEASMTLLNPHWPILGSFIGCSPYSFPNLSIDSSRSLTAIAK